MEALILKDGHGMAIKRKTYVSGADLKVIVDSKKIWSREELNRLWSNYIQRNVDGDHGFYILFADRLSEELSKEERKFFSALLDVLQADGHENEKIFEIYCWR